MIFFEASVNTDEFQDWILNVQSNFLAMVQTMVDVAEVIKAETLPRTPYLTGQLGESFEWKVLEKNSNFIEVEVKMDAVDPDTGFHYAEYQHEEDLNHPSPRAGEKGYLRKGIQASMGMAYQIIEQDYLSLFN